MDTSILGRLFEMTPDLMREVELRALVLERVAALEPVGRRALAARLHLAEREVRSAADALKASGCIALSAAGMELTEKGRNLIETARAVSRSRRSLVSAETALAGRLNVERVCVVHGDADKDASVMEAAAKAAAQHVRLLLHDVRVLAVSGGELMAQTAQELAPAAPIDVIIVPAQGGTGGRIRSQANTVAEAFAAKLGGQSRILHLPEGLSQEAERGLAYMPQVREALELARSAELALYAIDGALSAALVRGMNPAERMDLMKSGAVAEAFGCYFDAEGRMVGAKTAHVLNPHEIGGRVKAAAIAVGHSRAEAIIALCLHHPHRLLITDEGAAHRMMELLRV